MAFHFVVSSGPKVPADAALRTMIRKQAMKDVALERRKRNQVCRTRRVTDVLDGSSAKSSSSSSTSCSSSESSPSEATPSSDLVRWQSLSPLERSEELLEDLFRSYLPTIIPNPLSAYEQVCIQYSVSLNDLSGLTIFGVCSPLVCTLDDQKYLDTLLCHKTEGYFRHVPSRYGTSTAITAAVDSVLAKARCRTSVSSHVAEARATALYTKALKEVQRSIQDEVRCQDSDTMCAIMLLCIYELLDSTREHAYQQHILGLDQLIRLRQASSFKSEYELALLYGSLGSIIMESVLVLKHCHLAEEQWHKAIMAHAEDSTWLTPRSHLTLLCRVTETHLPGLIGDINIAVNDGTIFDDDVNDKLGKRAAQHHQELLDCLDKYRAHVMQVSLLSPPQSELDLRREIFGGILEHLCILKRVLGIIYDNDRPRLEAELHAVCLLLDEVASQPGPKHAWLFNSHEHSIVEGIRRTQHLWAQDLHDLDESERRKARMTMWHMYFFDLSAMTTEELDAAGAYARMIKAHAG